LAQIVSNPIVAFVKLLANMSANLEGYPSDYRLRFFNFNMANNKAFRSLEELQGPNGRGLFEETLAAPFSDGSAVDLVFITLVETRLQLGEWVHEHLAKEASQLDVIRYQNACREGVKNCETQTYSLLQGLASSYNGNLKSILAFSSKCFRECGVRTLFGRLADVKVAGMGVPNPKKSFVGRTVEEIDHGIRFCLTGAHFPIHHIAHALDAETEDPLPVVKSALAQTLRKVLRRAYWRGIIDARTVIIVQGDLNSRTVLHPSGDAHDALLELLNDDVMQAAINHGLSIPPGRWREMVKHDSVRDLPVTYKFRDVPGQEVAQQIDYRTQLTLGNVLDASRTADARCSGHAANTYRKALLDMPAAVREAWAIDFKEKDFRPFRFPASVDRIIYWAPESLAGRLSWSLPRGGYEVNHRQTGSDHRPVCLEVLLRVEPRGHFSDVASEHHAAQSAVSPPDDVIRTVSKFDDQDSGVEDEVSRLRTRSTRKSQTKVANWALACLLCCGRQ